MAPRWLSLTRRGADWSGGVSNENPNGWRLQNVRHLKGLRLQFRRYTRWSETWEHDHCSACWAKFAEFDGPDIQHEGYATGDDYKYGAGYDWICCDCFDDLKADLGWRTDQESSSSPDY
jgi:hypothetical protein